MSMQYICNILNWSSLHYENFNFRSWYFCVLMLSAVKQGTSAWFVSIGLFSHCLSLLHHLRTKQPNFWQGIFAFGSESVSIFSIGRWSAKGKVQSGWMVELLGTTLKKHLWNERQSKRPRPEFRTTCTSSCCINYKNRYR